MAGRDQYAISGMDAQSIELDPSAPGTILRWALALEAGINIPFGIAMFAYPRPILNWLLANPSDITPASVSLVQTLGIAPFIVTIPMALAARNTKSGVESRRPTYTMLLGTEILLLGLWVCQRYVLGEKESGLQKKALDIFIFNIAPMACWRVFALFWKPEWFGRWTSKGKTS